MSSISRTHIESSYGKDVLERMTLIFFGYVSIEVQVGPPYMAYLVRKMMANNSQTGRERGRVSSVTFKFRIFQHEHFRRQILYNERQQRAPQSSGSSL